MSVLPSAALPRRDRGCRFPATPLRAAFVLAAALAAAVLTAAPASADAAAEPSAPTALVRSKDGEEIYAALGPAQAIVVVDAAGTLRRRIALPGYPSGLALSPDGTRLAVTCAAPRSLVCLVDLRRGEVVARLPAGHTALGPVFSPDGSQLYVCERHDHDVLVIDVARRRGLARIPVEREPVAAALTPDGRRLLVANHLPAVAAGAAQVAASVTVIDPAARRVTHTLSLPNGSNLLLGLAVSPDGRYAAVTHNLARFYVPTTQVERGWMNTSALSLIDAAAPRVINTVLLDNVERGAANPWAVAWTDDGGRLLVTHAGTHELSVIDFPGLLAKLERLPDTAPIGAPAGVSATTVKADVPTDLAFLVGLRRRIVLHGQGPRSLAVMGTTAWIGNYFSDAVEAVDFGNTAAASRVHPLGPPVPFTEIRLGERLFNDATLCFQHWQSCASCHSYDARVDGLNWDLLNDGLGSPKNTKSLLWAHRTPPAMSLGVRATAEIAVRAGFRHSLFAVPPASEPAAIDAYLKSLEPQPSPALEAGQLSAAARRGKKIFDDPRVGCATCHPPPLFTDLESYDVGTGGPHDGPNVRFDTPTLTESWRTAPYLHDGSARTLRDVFTRPDRGDKHGATSHLKPAQLDDLVAYVRSL